MILVDTSAWVEFDRGTDSPADLRLQHLIASGADIAVSEPILMEVLAGARNDVERVRLRRMMTSFSWIPADAQNDFEAAARVYAACRAAGFTPRGLVDCLIATIAIRTGASLLTADTDFARMADVLPLRLDRHDDWQDAHQ